MTIIFQKVREEEIHRVIRIWEQREREIYHFEDLVEKGAETVSIELFLHHGVFSSTE